MIDSGFGASRRPGVTVQKWAKIFRPNVVWFRHMAPPRLLNRPPLRDNGPPPLTRGVRPAAPGLSRISAKVLEGLARQTRFVDPELIARWTAIAGPEISRMCRPGRLTGGREGRTLEVIVPHGAAAASVEFASETLKKRLNDYFGPNAIVRIAIVQGPAPKGAGTPPAAPGGGLSRFRTGGPR